RPPTGCHPATSPPSWPTSTAGCSPNAPGLNPSSGPDPMRVIYADPGLRDDLGHHANACRTIRREFARRGVTVVVLAFAEVLPTLRDELHAMPFFRAYTYWQSDHDP